MKHDNLTMESDFFGKEKISRILIQIAPPVMLAQLIQALYNIVDLLLFQAGTIIISNRNGCPFGSFFRQRKLV